MKKIHTYIIPALAALLALSCQQEMHDPASASGEEVTVSFTVNIPEAMQSKALGPGYGEEINCLAIELYTDADCKTLYTSKTIVGNPGEKWRNIQMTLFKDRTYYMLLVASASDSQVKPAEGTTFRNGIKLNYASVTDAASADMNGNDDKKDFFYAFKKVTTAELTQQIELQRPVAQINFITTDHAAITDLEDFIVGTTEITVKGVSDTFNPITGKAGETADVTFKANSIMETAEDASNQWLTMDYIIPALSGKNTVDIDATFRYTYKGIPAEATYNLRDVPVESKYRTNISGNIFTGEADFTFTLAPISSTEHNTEVWDGTTTDPVVPETSDPNTYIITTAEQLAWFRDMVNGNVEASASTASVKSGTNLPAETFEGKTVRLGADIDLAGQEWEPIGYTGQYFKGTFDGNGKTIKNFKVSEKHHISKGGQNHQAALFGAIAGTVTIKNLTVENAVITYPGTSAGDYYGAAVVGTAYGANVLDNIKVVNCTIEGNNKVAGILAHDGVSTSLTITNCHVSKSTISTRNSEDGGNVGGLVGLIQTKNSIVKDCSVKDCTINAINSSDTGKRGNSQLVGSIIARVQEFNLTIQNCTVSGNTFNETGRTTYVSPYGDGTLVGGARVGSGLYIGTVIIDGVKIIGSGVGITEDGTYEVSSAAGLSTALSETTGAGAGDNVIELKGNIDMSSVDWTPVKVDGYHGAGVITINGNGAVISGIDAPLFAGGFAGNSGIVINDLTIDASNIVSTNTTGAGGFIESVDSMNEITLNNCHINNSTISGPERVGGLIGWTSGYDNQNDGPVKTYITVKDCSVKGCTITCAGSVGGIIGHAGANAWTYTTVTDCEVSGCTLTSTDDGGWRVGVVVGTANVGEMTISKITESNNKLSQLSLTAPAHSNLYGRFVPGNTGKLTIDGSIIIAAPSSDDAASVAAVQTAINAAVATEDALVTMPDGTYTLPAHLGEGVTISGTEKTVLDLTSSVPAGAKNVTFEGITMDWKDTQQYKGFTASSGTELIDVNINGCYFHYGTDIVFRKCTFTNETANYNIWTYSGTTITFEECEFIAPEGKSVLICQDGSSNNQVITFNKCKFTAQKTGMTWDGKEVTAIDIDSKNGTGTYVVNINECSVTGFGTGSVSKSNQWNHKAGNNAVTVNIDGVKVYSNIE
ncbi:MAG: hypothetical protein IJX11_04315 [Bacteroidales bacterium]|nr:hypothetical protein [Bacteroidales bacterium]